MGDFIEDFLDGKITKSKLIQNISSPKKPPVHYLKLLKENFEDDKKRKLYFSTAKNSAKI